MLRTNIYCDKLEHISDLKIFLKARATENAVAGYIWLAGCYLPTPALTHTV